jgi:hypothetical protein
MARWVHLRYRWAHCQENTQQPHSEQRHLTHQPQNRIPSHGQLASDSDTPSDQATLRVSEEGTRDDGRISRCEGQGGVLVRDVMSAPQQTP